MKLRNRLILGVGALLTTSMLMGAGTYAYFSASQSVDQNLFQSAQIKLTGFRNDVPIAGPMFYTNSDYANPNNPEGIMGTGYWKPGDTNTRGFFIQNTGSVDVKLTSVAAQPDGTTSLADANAFGEQADATIMVIRRGPRLNPSVDPNEGIVSQSLYAEMVKYLDNYYQQQLDSYLQSYPSFPYMTTEQKKVIFAAFHAHMKQTLLNTDFELDDNGDPVQFYVEKVWQGRLKSLLDAPQDVFASDDYYMKVNESRYFAYNISFLDLDPSVNNVMQGKDIQLKFLQTWRQK